MTYKLLSIMLVLLMLGACGIQGELVRPSDIPAYEQERENRDGSLPL